MAASEKRLSKFDKAIAWIRANCEVDTGDGIYGNAGKNYTSKQIASAILEWSKKLSSKK